MALSVFHDLALAAVSTVVPQKEVICEDELAYHGNSLERAQRFVSSSGLRARRVADPGVTASDLAIQAAELLFAEADVDPRSIDALLFVSHSPDYLLPPSAVLQHHALGLSPHCAALDMNVGCAGFVAGTWLGAGLIASGACKRFLLLTGDTPNRFLDPANRITLPVFGDAASAALLEYREGAPPMSFLMGTDGGKYEALVVPGGGSRIPQRRDEGPESPFNAVIEDSKGNPWSLGDYAQIWMNGMGIYSFSLSVVPPHLRRHAAEAGVDLNGLDRLLLHPANKVIVQALAGRLGIAQEKAPFEALSRYGNTGSASIPVLMCDAFSAGAGVAGSGKTMMCGFGAGLSWASCLCSLEQCRVIPVRDYVPAKPVRTRDEHIAHWHRKFAGE